MLRPSTVIRAGFVLFLAVIVVALAQYQPTPTAGTVYASQSDLATFVDKPSDATETYAGSGIYKRATISPEIEAAVKAQSQEDWEKYHIAKESNLGLPLGSVFLQAANGKYVELALYERAAFTVFEGKPARQILSTIIFEGRVQVTEDEFISVPSYLRSTFASLPIAGEGGDQSTPLVGTVAKLLSTDKAKAVDAGWSKADQLFRWDGTFVAPDSSLKTEPLLLGQPDATTGHKVPDVISAGLTRLFSEKVVENAGLPLSPAVWMLAQVKGAQTVVCVQVFQRAIVTYNPANDESNRVQVGLGGGIVQGGLGSNLGPTATPLPSTPAATPKPYEGTLTLEVSYKGGTASFITQEGGAIFKSRNSANLAIVLDTGYDTMGYSANVNYEFISLPVGTLDGAGGERTYSGNGRRIYVGSRGSSEGLFSFYNTAPEEKNRNGVKTITIYFSSKNDEGSKKLLKNSAMTEKISASVLMSLLGRMVDYPSSDSGGVVEKIKATLGQNRVDALAPFFGGYHEESYNLVPLTVLPPSE